MNRKDVKRPKINKLHKNKLFLIVKILLKPKISIALSAIFALLLFNLSGYYDKSVSVVYYKYKEFSLNSNLILKDVILYGNKNTSKQNILDALDISYSNDTKSIVKTIPILSIDLKNMHDKLTQIEWVESATIERLLPSTLNIKIVERTPFALWQNNRKIRLIDSNGEIINVQDLEKFADLVILIGDQAQSYAGLIFKIINQEPELARRVSSLIFVSNRRWNVKMFNGVEIKLPEQNTQKAWAELARMQADSQILDSGAKMLDMRIKDKIYIE